VEDFLGAGYLAGAHFFSSSSGKCSCPAALGCVAQNSFGNWFLENIALFLSAGAQDLFYICSSNTPVLPGSSSNKHNLYWQKLLLLILV